MSIYIRKRIDNISEVPDYLRECLDKIDFNGGDELVNEFETTFELDDNFKRVFFGLDKLCLECEYFRAWAVMEAVYGFIVEYDSKKKVFGIGGYESERLESKTLMGLIRKLERGCK